MSDERAACLHLPIKWPNRRKAIEHLFPKRSVGLELGVFEGAFAEALIKTTTPVRSVFVDKWSRAAYSDAATPFKQKVLDRAHVKALGCLGSLMAQQYVRSIRYFEQGVVTPSEDYYHGTPSTNKHVDVMQYLGTDAVPFFPDNYFDWIHIDADHAHAAALRDMHIYASKLKIGGFMLCHDFIPLEEDWGVDTAVKQFIIDRPEFSPIGVTGDEDESVSVVLQRQEQ